MTAARTHARRFFPEGCMGGNSSVRRRENRGCGRKRFPPGRRPSHVTERTHTIGEPPMRKLVTRLVLTAATAAVLPLPAMAADAPAPAVKKDGQADVPVKVVV